MPGVPFSFIGLPGVNASADGVYAYNLTVNVSTAALGLEVNAGPLGLVQAALLAADQAFLPYIGIGRRRLLASTGCYQGFYTYDYPALGLQCVPCLFDPLPSSNASEPQSAWWRLAVNPCPTDQARVCYGGQYAPVCVPRSGVASLQSVSAAAGPPACPSQQSLDSSGACVGVPCAPGWSGTPGYCQPCAAGAFSTSTGSLVCPQCATGTFSTAIGANSSGVCTPCQSAGTSSAGASSESDCVCVPGYEGNYTAGCRQCAAGEYQAGGASACSPCPAGAYTGSSGAPYCQPCGQGWYQNASGSSACQACTPGSYQPVLGGSVCGVCQPGAFQSSQAATECQPCAAGEHQTYAGATWCVSCDPGWFQAAAGMTTCAPCAAGTFTAYSGATVCQACPGNDTFADSAGMSSCTACPNGSATDAAGATACLLCPEAEGVLGAACSACSPGSEARDSRCWACAAGSYSPSGARCQACAAGSSSPSGASACDACLPGTAGVGCAPCGRGSFASGHGQVTCTSCAIGKYSAVSGATSVAACVNCEQGTYSLLPGFCAPCPAGTTSPPASEAEQECMSLAGFYALPGRPGTPCPANSFCMAGTMRPTPCPPGTFSSAGASTCLVPSAGMLAAFWDWVAGPAWLLVRVPPCVMPVVSQPDPACTRRSCWAWRAWSTGGGCSGQPLEGPRSPRGSRCESRDSLGY